jgi:hypothetical protein
MSAVGPLVAFYDIPKRKGEVSLYSSVPDTTWDIGPGEVWVVCMKVSLDILCRLLIILLKVVEFLSHINRSIIISSYLFALS